MRTPNSDPAQTGSSTKTRGFIGAILSACARPFRRSGSGAPSSRRSRRLILLAGLAATATLAALVAVVVPALAAGPPALTTGPATEIGITTVKLSGTVNPEGSSGEAANTIWYLQVSPVGQEAWAGGPGPTIEGTAAEESNPVAVSQVLGGAGELSGGTEYEYRLYAEGPGGISETPHPYPTFTTEGATAPTLTLAGASEVSYTSAHLSGTVDPEGGNTNPGASEPLPIEWQLQLAPASEPGNWQFSESGTIQGTGQADSNSALPVAASFTGLAPAREYTARLLIHYAGLQATAAEEPTFTTKAVATPSVSLEVPAFTATTAHLVGHIDPNAPGAAPQDPAFDVHWHFQCTPTCPAIEGGEVAADDTSHEVSVQATGLAPHTAYEVVLIAENAGGAETEVTAGPALFTTPAAAPAVGPTFVSELGSGSATLNSEVTPDGAETTYRFEYGTDTGYGASTPTSGPLPADDQGHPVSAQVSGLAAATTYHFRLVASNAVETVHGPDAEFTTPVGEAVSGSCPNASSRTGASALLPDCRAYEMVTPPENHGASVYQPFVVRNGTGLPQGRIGILTKLPFQAAPDGDSIAYIADPAESGHGLFGNLQGDNFLATRQPGGAWAQRNLQPPGNKSAWYQGFSPDLSQGFLQAGEGFSGYEERRISEAGTPGSLVEEPEVPLGGYKYLYAHPLDGNLFRPFFATTPPNRNAEEFGTSHLPEIGEGVSNGPIYAGTSADQRELSFEANDVLAPGGLDGGASANNLYLSSAGRPALVNVLPGGGSEPGATFGSPSYGGSTNPPDFEHVISSDGSHAFWTDLNTNVLYASEGIGTPDERTIQLDASEGPGSSGGGRYWTASTDGSRVFFTDEGRLTADSTAAPGAPDLYEYDFDRPEGERLSDLSVDPHPGEAAAVQGLLGTSEDGSYAYFVAQGVLAGNANRQGVKAEAGQDNLYVLRNGATPRFIAVLAPADGNEALGRSRLGAEFGDWQSGLGYRTAEVTPDGTGLTFMSENQAVDGYSPELSGRKLEEVYVYDFRQNRTWCASCDPSHAISPINPFTVQGRGAFLPPSWSFTYLPHWFSSDGGRVVFDSAEPLVARDVNNLPDVYEWERGGEGSCEKAAGCIYLLSAGTSGSASWLGGESASGNDVFVITRSQLTLEDGNENFNLFDARVGGVAAPSSAAPCSGWGCEGPPAGGPSFATPPSTTFAGAGNQPSKAKSKVKHKKKRKRHHKKKTHSHKRRTARKHRGTGR